MANLVPDPAAASISDISMSDIICQADNNCNSDDSSEKAILSVQQKDNPGISGISLEMPDTIGLRLRRLRNKMKMTQLSVANEVDSSQNHISSIENDKEIPGRELLTRLAELYDTTVDFLLFGISPEDELMKSIQDEETRWIIKIINDSPPDFREKVIGIIKLLMPEKFSN